MPNSIGYLEYGVATQNQLSVVSLQSRAWQFAAPSPASFQAAAIQADWQPVSDFDLSLTDKAGSDSYPIVATAYVLMSRRATSRNTHAVIDFSPAPSGLPTRLRVLARCLAGRRRSPQRK